MEFTSDFSILSRVWEEGPVAAPELKPPVFRFLLQLEIPPPGTIAFLGAAFMIGSKQGWGPPPATMALLGAAFKPGCKPG
jgi:hypothetical protein